jgi:hypothetical protein
MCLNRPLQRAATSAEPARLSLQLPVIVQRTAIRPTLDSDGIVNARPWSNRSTRSVLRKALENHENRQKRRRRVALVGAIRSHDFVRWRHRYSHHTVCGVPAGVKWTGVHDAESWRHRCRPGKLWIFVLPPPISGNDLCGSTSTNPSGGTPPYTFELGTAGGFPPIGMHLNLNGTLTGTPSVAGTSNFVVCAVDLARSSKCDTVQFTVDSPSTTPPPATGSRYAATYDFSFVHPSPGGSATEVLNQFWFVRTDGLVGSSDRTVSGSVDSSGNVRFTGPCWTSSGGTATFTGTLSDASPKSGSGTYVCALNGINGGMWRVYNGR